MAKVTLGWSADPDSAVVSYSAVFTHNGTPLLPATVVPAVPGQATYSTDFPGILNPGDVIGGSVQSKDSFGQVSPFITSVPGTVTVPLPAAPTGPVNVTLVLA